MFYLNLLFINMHVVNLNPMSFTLPYHSLLSKLIGGLYLLVGYGKCYHVSCES
jgi:flagellar biosynthesis protein FliP